MLIIGMYLLCKKVSHCHSGKVTLRELSRGVQHNFPLLLTKQQ